MAKNTGHNHRRGAVCNCSQTHNPKSAEKHRLISTVNCYCNIVDINGDLFPPMIITINPGLSPPIPLPAL